MKKRFLKGFLILLGVALVAAICFLSYIYIGFNGNPLQRMEEKKELVKYYQELYNEAFNVVESGYSYKRHEFNFTLASESNPDITFKTNVNEIGLVDAYAAARCADYVTREIQVILGESFDLSGFSFYVSEQGNATNPMETDMTKRLADSTYFVSMSKDADLMAREDLDNMLAKMKDKVSEKWEAPVDGLTLGIYMWDGESSVSGDIQVIGQSYR